MSQSFQFKWCCEVDCETCVIEEERHFCDWAESTCNRSFKDNRKCRRSTVYKNLSFDIDLKLSCEQRAMWNEITSLIVRVLYNGHHNDDAHSLSLCK